MIELLELGLLHFNYDRDGSMIAASLISRKCCIEDSLENSNEIKILI